MTGQFFEIPNKRSGVFTPKVTVETSILRLFQRLQVRFLKAAAHLEIKKNGFFWACHGHVLFFAR